MAGTRAASTATVVGFVNVAHFIDHMFLLIFPTAVLGMGREFGWSYGELLALSVGTFVMFGAGSLPAGWLGDRWSRRNMMIVFFLGIGASTALTGLSPSPPWLAAGLTLIGVFSSIYHPIAGAMLAANAGGRLGRVMGLNGVFGNIGIATAALATGALTQFLGWRWAFIIPGAAAALVGLAFWLAVPDGAGKAAAGKAARKLDIPRALVVRVFAVLTIVILVGGLIFQGATIALPKLVDERVGRLADSAATVGALAAAIYAVGALAQLVVGRLVDRYSLKTSFLLVSAFAAPGLLVAAYAEDALMLVAAGAVMIAIFGQVTINDTMVARYTTDEFRSRVFAVRYFVGFGVAAAAVPLISILHQKGGGFGPVFLLLGALGALVFVAALLFPREQSHLKAAPAPAE
ncbi:MAG: MFS transporter [Rhodospirillales bacterium]